MNILVTGGLGINGVWTVRELLDKGHKPIVFENRMDPSLIPDIAKKVDIVLGDILDVRSILRVLKEYKIKRIIHLAAVMSQETEANPCKGFEVNALGTVNILEAARVIDVERVVFASSKAALGAIKGQYASPKYKPVSESYPVGQSSVYSAGKVASELMGNTYAKLFGLEFVAFRFATIWAPGKAASGRYEAYAVQGKMINNAMRGEPTIIPEGGDARDDMLYVKDVAHALVLGCLADCVPHQLYHIGTGVAYTLHQFAKSIKELYPDAIFQIGPGLDYKGGHGQYCAMDFSLAKKDLGYTPRFSLSDGIRDYVEEVKRLEIESLA
jgi:UDP-glucose 4-epimerase